MTVNYEYTRGISYEVKVTRRGAYRVGVIGTDGAPAGANERPLCVAWFRDDGTVRRHAWVKRPQPEVGRN